MKLSAENVRLITGHCLPETLSPEDHQLAAGVSPLSILRRHTSGDWGDLDTDDRKANEAALVDGSRIFSSYKLPNGEKVWVITTAEDDQGRRESTCILLPDGY